MRLICPACGAMSSLEAMSNDPMARETMAAIVQLAHPLPVACLGYLAMFRASNDRALSWKKAKRVVAEIAALTGAGYVSVRGRVDRNCPPRVWAEAMEIVAISTTVTRPLEGHNYLSKVAWDRADQADRDREAATRTSEQSHQRPGQREEGPVRVASINPLAHLMED